MTPLDAHDLLKFAAQYEAKLKTAVETLSHKRKLEREKAWLSSAHETLAAELSTAPSLLDRARELSDLAPVRAEYAGVLQGEWVDILEKLVAGITFHAGSRAPLIETLFPHVKFPVLRKPNRASAEQFHADFQKRLKLSYVVRILAQEDFAFIQPVLAQVDAAWARYQSAFSDGGLPEDAAAPLREELLSAGKRIELVLQQVRFLAEAALLPVKNAFEDAGLQAKPKKRAGKVDPAALEAALSGGVAPEGGSEGAPEGSPASEAEVNAAEAEAVAEALAPEGSAAPVQVVESAPLPAAVPVAEVAPVEAAPVAPVKKPRKKKAAPAVDAASPVVDAAGTDGQG